MYINLFSAWVDAALIAGGCQVGTAASAMPSWWEELKTPRVIAVAFWQNGRKEGGRKAGSGNAEGRTMNDKWQAAGGKSEVGGRRRATALPRRVQVG